MERIAPGKVEKNVSTDSHILSLREYFTTEKAKN